MLAAASLLELAKGCLKMSTTESQIQNQQCRGWIWQSQEVQEGHYYRNSWSEGYKSKVCLK